MLLIALVFTAMTLLSFGLLALFTRPSSQERVLEKRLSAVTAKGSTVSLTGPLNGLLKQPLVEGQLARFDLFLDRFHFYERLERLIRQAHRRTTPGKLVLHSAACMVVAWIAGSMFAASLTVLLVMMTAAAFAPLLLLRFQRKRRVQQFNRGLSDAVDLMSRALKAGHSVASAMEVVAEQGPEPVASEFGEVFQSQNFGLPFRDALLQLVERVPSADLHLLVTAMLVQKETGGNLTEILDRTTHVIRERFRIQGEVRTKTAQGRLTGWILTLLPIVLGFLINMVNPGYAAPLFHDPLGKKMLCAAAAMISLGGFIISRIVRIEV